MSEFVTKIIILQNIKICPPSSRNGPASVITLTATPCNQRVSRKGLLKVYYISQQNLALLS